jgi:hypothetical protein
MTATLENVFGAGTTQDATHLHIPKANFVQYGLSPDANDNPQALFVCMVRQASIWLTEARRADDRAIQPVTVTYSGQDALEDITGSGDYVNRKVFTVILYRPVTFPDFSVQFIEPAIA